MNNNRTPNYDAELQTKLSKTTGRPLKRLLDGTETGLLRPNSWRMMMFIILIFSVIFTDRHVIVLNIFFIILLANCGSAVLSFDLLGLSRAVVWLVILKLLTYEINLMFYVITYTLGIFVIYYMYSACTRSIQAWWNSDECKSTARLQRYRFEWACVYLEPPNLRWNGTKGSVHDVCLTYGLDVYMDRCRRRCCCVFSRLVILCGWSLLAFVSHGPNIWRIKGTSDVYGLSWKQSSAFHCGTSRER